MTGAWIGLWCKDPACPTCYGAYADRAAEDAVERLIGGHQAWKAAGGGPQGLSKTGLSLLNKIWPSRISSLLRVPVAAAPLQL